MARWLAGHGTLAVQETAGLRRLAPEWPGQQTSRGPLPTLIFSQVAWDDVWQRPQEMARGLARHRPVLFVGPVQVHQTAGPLRGRWSPVRLEQDGRLLILSPQILTGEYRSALVRRINRVVVARAIRPFVEGQRFHFLTNTPFCEPLIDGLRPASVGYDLIDDFCAFEWAPPDGRQLEDRLAARAEFGFAGTWTLFERYRDRVRDLEFLASGVDAEKLARKAEEPTDLRGLPRPRLLYVGTLNDRLSGALIDRVARAMPRASIVLVGPRRATFEAPAFPPNVHELGLKPHDALAGYYQHCDLGMMPFADNEAARAINPVKTLEYLACGLPVLSTPIPDVERFYVPPVEVRRPEAWTGAMEEMLASDNDVARENRRRFAQGRTWKTMADRVDEVLKRVESGRERMA